MRFSFIAALLALSAFAFGRDGNWDATDFVNPTPTLKTAPVADIMVAVPTSNTCMMCGALPARNAAMPAFMVSG